MKKENKNTPALIKSNKKRRTCRHDHRNAIQVGNVDYMCQLCGELIDPLEWFFMNYFNFVDEKLIKSNKK